MPGFAKQIAYHLAQFRRGNADDAFHGLLELESGILPDLISEFRSTADTDVRAFLVNVIWQYREQSVIPFLGEALFDAERKTWRQALDGLVALASPAAFEVLRVAKARGFANQRENKEFHWWLEDAIEQAQAQIDKSPV